MAGIESEIISRENVRPSSPTPQNLRNYKLSLLDQVYPCIPVPVLLYYTKTTQTNDLDSFITQTTTQLKRSLAAILTRFHPFAGRANRDGLSIDCNDEGVPFVVAKFRGQNLSDLLRDTGTHTWQRHLLPCDVTSHARLCIGNCAQLQIQVNYFDGDNSVAIGAAFSHRVADAPAIAAFLNSWAAACRGLSQPVCPNYILPSIFPQIDDRTKIQFINSFASMFLRRGRSVTRTYVFDAAAISSLKSRSGGGTRVELVSALMWKCFMAASLANNVSSSVLTHAVNLRRRAEPPFPADCFGNFQGVVAAASSNDDANNDLVRKIRESISKIDGDYIERMSGDGGMEGYRENLERKMSGIPEGADFFHCSSWCNLGFYDADFGWGKAVSVRSYVEGNDDPDSVFGINCVYLMDNGDGDGIEATIILDERYISAFENAYCCHFSPA